LISYRSLAGEQGMFFRSPEKRGGRRAFVVFLIAGMAFPRDGGGRGWTARLAKNSEIIYEARGKIEMPRGALMRSDPGQKIQTNSAIRSFE